MTPSEEERILKAWLNECQTLAVSILGETNPYGLFPPAKQMILEKAIRPYHYFRQEYIERGLLEASAKPTSTSSPIVRDGSPPVKSPVVKCHVEGPTMPHKEYLKSRGGRWDPNRKVWGFSVLGDAFPKFCADMEGRGLKVVSEDVQ